MTLLPPITIVLAGLFLFCTWLVGAVDQASLAPTPLSNEGFSAEYGESDAPPFVVRKDLPMILVAVMMSIILYLMAARCSRRESSPAPRRNAAPRGIVLSRGLDTSVVQGFEVTIFRGVEVDLNGSRMVVDVSSVEPSRRGLSRLAVNIRAGAPIRPTSEQDMIARGASVTEVAEAGLDSPDADSCDICWDPYKPGDKIMKLPCLNAEHRGHDACLLRWFQVSSTCPWCRNDLSLAGNQAPEQNGVS